MPRPTPPTGWWSWSSTLRHDPRPHASNLSSMCGIVGVVRRRATRPVPDAAVLVEALDRALAATYGDATTGDALTDALAAVATLVEGVDRELRGVPGVR